MLIRCASRIGVATSAATTPMPAGPRPAGIPRIRCVAPIFANRAPASTAARRSSARPSGRQLGREREPGRVAPDRRRARRGSGPACRRSSRSRRSGSPAASSRRLPGRRARGRAVFWPPSHIGGPPGVSGGGRFVAPSSGIERIGPGRRPARGVAASENSALIVPTADSNRSNRSRIGGSGIPNGTCSPSCQPAPRPRMNRPPVTWSRSVAAFASERPAGGTCSRARRGRPSARARGGRARRGA